MVKNFYIYTSLFRNRNHNLLLFLIKIAALVPIIYYRPPNQTLIRQNPDSILDGYENPMRRKVQRLPSAIDLAELMVFVVYMRQYTIAFQLFDQMLQRDASEKDNTFSILMSLFHEMEMSWRDAPIDLDCFCRSKRSNLWFPILHNFLKCCYEPNFVAFNTLIKGLI